MTTHLFILSARDHRRELDLGEDYSAWSALVVAGGALLDGGEPAQREEVRTGVPVTIGEVVTRLSYDMAVATMEEETGSRFPALYRAVAMVEEPPLPPLTERYGDVRPPVDDGWVLDESTWAVPDRRWRRNPALEAIAPAVRGIPAALAADVPPRKLDLREGDDATEVGRFPGLRELNLKGAIPREIGYLRQLVQLTADRSGLTRVPDTLGDLAELRGLSLEENRLQTLPAGIGRLTRLLDLNLSRNALVEVPDTLGHLAALRRLSLRENRLRRLPRSFSQLQRLERLDLMDNKHLDVVEALDTLGPCPALRVLNLGSIPLPAGPFVIPPSVRTLEWDYCCADDGGGVPFNEALLSNPNLTSLTWSARCSALAKAFGLLTKLETLDLSGNYLSDLPASFVGLRALRTLDLSQDRGLRKLPPVLLEMPWLEALRINGGGTLTLPADLGRMAGLRKLEVTFCKVTLPDAGLAGLAQLEQLDLSDTTIAFDALLASVERGLPALKALKTDFPKDDKARLAAARPDVTVS